MNLMLNDILYLSPEEIKNSKIELNMDIGSGAMNTLLFHHIDSYTVRNNLHTSVIEMKP